MEKISSKTHRNLIKNLSLEKFEYVVLQAVNLERDPLQLLFYDFHKREIKRYLNMD